jgi:hypothetical protein
MPGGRPSTYSTETAEKICERIATSNRGVQRICAEDSDLPSMTTVMKWLHKFPEFDAMYARAKALQMEFMEAEIIDISDEPAGDAYIDYDKDQNPVAKIDGRAVQRSRLMVDTRKWLMAKLNARRYGDKVDVTSGGEKLPTPAAPVLIDARVQSLLLIAQDRLKQQPQIEDLMD